MTARAHRGVPVLALVVGLWQAQATTLSAQDDAKVIAQYNQLKSNGLAAMRAGRVKLKRFTTVDGREVVAGAVGKFAIDSVPSASPGGRPIEVGVKVWGELF